MSAMAKEESCLTPVLHFPQFVPGDLVKVRIWNKFTFPADVTSDDVGIIISKKKQPMSKDMYFYTVWFARVNKYCAPVFCYEILYA
jgi:hypothetical protein